MFKVPEFLPDVSGISLDASFSAVTVVSILLSPKIFFVIEILFAFLTSWKIPLSISVGLWSPTTKKKKVKKISDQISDQI